MHVIEPTSLWKLTRTIGSLGAVPRPMPSVRGPSGSGCVPVKADPPPPPPCVPDDTSVRPSHVLSRGRLLAVELTLNVPSLGTSTVTAMVPPPAHAARAVVVRPSAPGARGELA